MKTATTTGAPHQGLLAWLATNDVEHEIHEHETTFGAASTARAEGVDPRTFAKVVGVATDDGRRALIVVDAPDHVDLDKARRALAANRVRLLSEPELTVIAPGCEAGAMPAVGSLFDLPTYADYAVREDDEISFNAGSHQFSVRVERPAWERATGVRYDDLAVAGEGPAWAR